mgnify:CR=1 FL=1
MSDKFSKGDDVSWEWGQGTASGTIVDIYYESITRTLQGTEVTRNGTEDNPAYLIEQEDGDKVLKLQSELNA